MRSRTSFDKNGVAGFYRLLLFGMVATNVVTNNECITVFLHISHSIIGTGSMMMILLLETKIFSGHNLITSSGGGDSVLSWMLITSCIWSPVVLSPSYHCAVHA